jgi:hypothetical protein
VFFLLELKLEKIDAETMSFAPKFLQVQQDRMTGG